MKKHVRLFEILFCVFAFCLAVFIAVYVAGEAYAPQVNTFLHTSSEKYYDEDGNELDLSDAEDYFEREYTSESDLREAYENLCQEVEEEGLVLMKNDNGALPLSPGANVSLFGQGSADWVYAATGSSSAGNSSSYATLKDALEKSGINVNDKLWNFYTGGANGGGRKKTVNAYMIYETPYSDFSSDVVSSFSSYGDAAIMTISRETGEGQDLSAAGSDGRDGSCLSLSEEEIDILVNLTTLKKTGTFKSIIVLLNTPATVQLDFLNESGIDVDAVLWVGDTGSHGLYGVAEVLCGNVNPSGKNSDTYVYDNFSSPATASWGFTEKWEPNSKGVLLLTGDRVFSQLYDYDSTYGDLNYSNKPYGVYIEGIYVGYRYYETRYEDYVLGNTDSYDYGADVAYPFGYGLSYTTFSYSDFSVTPSVDGESFDVSVTVTNTGNVPGKEAVEVYLQKPYTDYDKTYGVEKASVELVGYEKTGVLDAAGGENDSQTVTITVQKEQFKSYDANGAETYILDAGDYYLSVGNGAHEAVNNILAAKNCTVSSTSGKMDADGNSNLVYKYTQDNFDDETYSVSTETGVEITNQLDFADPNRYENYGNCEKEIVTYVSRSDWAATFPTKSESLSVASQGMYYDLQSNDPSKYDMSSGTMPNYGVDNKVETTKVDEETGEEYVVYRNYSLYMLRSTEEDEIAYDDARWDLLLDRMTYGEQVSLVRDGYHQTVTVESINKPQTDDQNGPVSVDGSVTGYSLPCEGIWASSFNDELLESIGELMGDDARLAGVNGLYAPGVNIHRSAFGGRCGEYFSEDPYLSGISSAAEIKGMQSRGVIAFVKHFAFNDEEEDRDGVGIWLNEQSAREIYLLPFEYSMRPSMGNSHACMTSFSRAGCKWASASSELLLNIARGEWDYEGYFITDLATNNGAYYMTALDGVMNGTNLYDSAYDEDPAYSTYSSSPAFCNMLRESCHRILYNQVNYSSSMVGMAGATVKSVTTWWEALLIALLVIAIVGVVASLALYIIAEVFKWRDSGGKAGNAGGGVRPKDADDDYDDFGDASPGDRE